MSRTLVVSDDLYGRLERVARQKGLGSVEQLLETWHASENDLRNRRETVEKIDALRSKLFQTYGEMPDSVGLLREDRAR